MADVTTDPYDVQAVSFAEANWGTVGLSPGDTPSPVKLGRLQVLTLRNLRELRKNGGPVTTASHLLAAARYGVAQASATLSKNASDVHGSYIDSLGGTITNVAGDALAPLHGIAAIGDLANKIAALMSGKRHILLRTAYVLFGGIALLAGVAILARELGMKTVSAQVSKTLGPVGISTTKTTGVKFGKTTIGKGKPHGKAKA